MNEMVYNLDDIVEKLRIPNGYRVPELVGCWGCFARCDIAENTIIGRYIGFECTNKEWKEIMNGSNIEGLYGQYVFSFDIEDGLDDDHDGSKQVMIDPLEGNMRGLKLLYINDIRCNIYKSVVDEED